MPDYKTLKIGDRVRIMKVPEGDLRQREREIARKEEGAGWTADTIEQIIIQNPVVIISDIAEYGSPWYDVEIINTAGKKEFHSLSISDDHSWEHYIKE